MIFHQQGALGKKITEQVLKCKDHTKNGAVWSLQKCKQVKSQ